MLKTYYDCKDCGGVSFDEGSPVTKCDNCGSTNIEKVTFETDKYKPKIPTCPYCKSTDTNKIGILSRSFSIGLFGLASGKVGKQWHCNRCKSDF